MIAVSNIQLSFGGRTMFDQVSFLINDNDKIGLTGRNGAGKSTLLKVLKGQQQIDGGDIMFPKGTIIGYLPQELHSQSQLSVMDETKKAFELVTKLMEEKDKVVHEMETRTDYESDAYMELIERLGELEHQIEIHGGYGIEEQTERVLKGLGFEPADFEKEMKSLSGGWQMRVELAKILLQNKAALCFSNLKNITPRAAKVISSYQGNILDFPALKSIHPKAFAYLTAFKNEFLTIGNLTQKAIYKN